MKRLKQFTISKAQLSEAAYPNNLGFEELCKFWNKATPAQEIEMDEILSKEDWEGFKLLIKKVVGTKLN